MLEYAFDENFGRWEKDLRETFPELDGCVYVESVMFSEWNTGGQTVQAIWRNVKDGAYYRTENSDYGVSKGTSRCDRVEETYVKWWTRA